MVLGGRRWHEQRAVKEDGGVEQRVVVRRSRRGGVVRVMDAGDVLNHEPEVARVGGDVGGGGALGRPGTPLLLDPTTTGSVLLLPAAAA